MSTDVTGGSRLKLVRLTMSCGRPNWPQGRCDQVALRCVEGYACPRKSAGRRLYICSESHLLHQFYLYLHATQLIIFKHYGLPRSGKPFQGTILKETSEVLGAFACIPPWPKRSWSRTRTFSISSKHTLQIARRIWIAMTSFSWNLSSSLRWILELFDIKVTSEHIKLAWMDLSIYQYQESKWNDVVSLHCIATCPARTPVRPILCAGKLPRLGHD